MLATTDASEQVAVCPSAGRDAWGSGKCWATERLEILVFILHLAQLKW